MSERRFRRIPGGVCSMGLRPVWCPKTSAGFWAGRAFNDRTARVLRLEFPHPRIHARVLWSPSDLTASVGEALESTLRRSVEPHCDAVMAS